MPPEGLLIVPTYNEAENLRRLIQEVRKEAPELDLLIIDDSSPDGTGAVADELAREIPLRVIHRPRKAGIGSAHKAGFHYAMEQGYRCAITMDADFAHSPHYLRQMLGRVPEADVVVGSRYLPGGGLSGWGLPRRILTHLAHGLTKCLLGMPYDCTGGFRLYRISALKAIPFDEIRSDGYSFLMEILFHLKKKGCSIMEIPIVIPSRHLGKSKISHREIFNAMKTLISLRRR